MDNQTIINGLRDKIAEIENTIDWMEKSGQVHPIDFDLLLKKTRDLYERIIYMAENAADDGTHKPILSKSKIVPETQIEEQPMIQPEPEPEPEPEIEPVKRFQIQLDEEPEPTVEPPLFFKAPAPAPAPVPAPESVQPPAKPSAPAEPVYVKPAPAEPPTSKPAGKEMHSNTVLFQREDSLNDALGKQKPIQDVASALTETPVADIWSAIAINDRFLFTRELFGNDSESFKTTVYLLNSISS